MKFRDDIDPENTWVVSDTHFGHDNIVGFCHRPEDHEQVILAEWRKEVPDHATVLHLGDLCYRGNARFKNIIARELTGARKLLIQGNHDRQRKSFYRQSGFLLVRPFAITVNENLQVVPPYLGQVVSFSHYVWSDSEEGLPIGSKIRVHGHIHNNGYTRGPYTPFLRNHINMSVEQTKYKPVNLKRLLAAALYGDYEETTQAQLDEAAARREANSERSQDR
jgi:calcineurin-like phosphoesterase family protein